MLQAVSCLTWSCYGPGSSSRVLSTKSLDYAVPSTKEQPVLCPMGTFTPRSV